MSDLGTGGVTGTGDGFRGPAPGPTAVTETERRALDRALRDLGFAADEVAAERISISGHQVMIQLSGSLAGVVVHGPDDIEEVATYWFADQLQDELVEGGAVIPVCAGHPHPAQAALDEVSRRARWQCPQTHELLAEIGRA